MTWNARDQEVTAFHESGHAVVHHFYGHGVDSIAIGKNSGYCKEVGECALSKEQIRELCQREVQLQRAIGCCAGRAAVRRLRGHRKDGHRHAHYGWRKSNDRSQALKYCLTLSDGDEVAAAHLLAYAMRRAELIVDGQWSQIHRLAFALLEHLKLDGVQIKGAMAA